MTHWSDERLDEAYRAMAAGKAPDDLPGATVAAVRRVADDHAGRRAKFPVALGRPASRLLGGGVAFAIVAAIVAGLVLRQAIGPATGPTTRPTAVPTASPTGSPASEPIAVDGLAVQSVSDALAAEKSGAIVGDSLVAIEGWYDPAFPIACPVETRGPALVETCASRKLFVSENKELLVTVEGNGMSGRQTPSGPYIAALEPEGSYVGAILPVGDPSSQASYDPSPVVVVGHFHDVRASDCGADRAACDASFVIDQIAWLDGKSFGPNVWIGADAADHVLKPRLDEAGVLAALRSSLDPHDVIVSMAGVGLEDLYSMQPGRGVGGSSSATDPNIQWYVRVAGPQPRWPEMAFQGGSSGWFVVEDDSGQVRAVGGWGFVPADDPAYVPSVRTLPSGDLALPTINQLSYSLCAGVGADAVLHGSGTDPRIAWLVSNAPGNAGARIDVAWPAGYRARFAPRLEILDENGAVVLTDGAHITGICSFGPPAVLEPPFL
jgi:hypothetical protein